jgi:hypoxanthine phosphoribosyltransferase
MNNVTSFVVGILSSIAAALILRLVIAKISLRFSFRRVLNDIRSLHSQIDRDRFVPDYIITIDRNGTIVGAILAGYFGVETVISIATVNHRLPDGSRTITVSEAHLPKPEYLYNKALLLVICFNDSGTSLEAVYRCLGTHPFQVKEMRSAALYTSVSPRFKPKYFVREAGRDLKTSVNRIVNKMPWMTREWRHVFARERLTDNKRSWES